MLRRIFILVFDSFGWKNYMDNRRQRENRVLHLWSERAAKKHAKEIFWVQLDENVL